MTRIGSGNVSDRRGVVVQDASRDKDAGRAIRIGRDAAVVDRTLESDNFEAGLSGWQLDRDTGNVEFNEGTFRGDLEAAGGTFSGNLSGAGGTFSGDLSAAGGSFSGNLSAAGGTFSGTVRVDAFVSGVRHRVQVSGGRTLVRRGNTTVGSILAQTDESGNTAGFFTLGYGLQDFSSPSGNRVQMTSNGVGIYSGIYGVGVSGTVTNINGNGRVNNSTIRTFANTSIPSGSRTTSDGNWTGGQSAGSDFTSNRNTSGFSTSNADVGSHNHKVPSHTHTVSI